jgi:hypothetical protein
VTKSWARENSQYPGKEVGGGGSGKRETDALTHPLFLGRHMPRLSHALVVTQILD